MRFPFAAALALLLLLPSAATAEQFPGPQPGYSPAAERPAPGPGLQPPGTEFAPPNPRGPSQGGQGPGRECAEDVRTLCADVAPGDGRIVMCLLSKIDRVSPACRAKIEQGKRQIQDAKQACEGDVRRLCADVAPGGGAIVRCLKANYDSLSPDCKQTFDRASQRLPQGRQGRRGR